MHSCLHNICYTHVYYTHDVADHNEGITGTNLTIVTDFFDYRGYRRPREGHSLSREE